jgi:hypothetical protein
VPTLILNAGTSTPTSLVVQRAGKAPPRVVGAVTPSANGANRSSVRGEAKVMPVVLTTFIDTAAEAAIKAAIMNGAQISCSGDLLANLQTLCSIDSYVANMVVGSSPQLWDVSFTVNEVNASTILMKYAPGDTVTGESFTTATGKAYRDINGLVAFAGLNVKRDGHYDFNDSVALSPSTLVEGPATNIALWSRDLSNAAWVKTNMTAARTSVGADGVAASASRLTATAANGTCTQSVTLASSQRFQSAYIKRITGVGAIQMTTDGGGTWTTLTLGAGFTRLSIPAQTVTNPNFGFRIVTSGDAIDVDFVQNETGACMTSPISTTTLAVLRPADLWSFPYPFPPGESTFYMRFIERGTVLTPGGTQFLIANAASASPALAGSAPAGFYRTTHLNGTTVTSTLAAAPAYSDTVELMFHFNDDGSVDISQCINSGAITTATQSAALAKASAWSGLFFWPNGSSASVNGYVAFKSIKGVTGARTMVEMRAA